MIQSTAEQNCTTCTHFRKGQLAAAGWHCALRTQAELTAEGRELPDGGESALKDFVCDEWEPP